MKKKVNKGYEVVYDHGGYTLPVGSHVVYPCYRLAAQYRARYEKIPMDGRKERLYKACRRLQRAFKA